jgi:hypothetical protein
MRVFPITEEITEGDGARLWLSDGKIIYMPPKTADKGKPAYLGPARKAGAKGYKFDRIHAAADPTLAPNEGTVREFVRIIHYYAARATNGLERPGGVLQLSRLHPTGGNMVPSRFGIGDEDMMIKTALDDAAAGHNIYTEGRTVREGCAGRGKIEDTAYVFAFVVDSDNDKDRAGTVPDGATITVESSPGNFHYGSYFPKLSRPVRRRKSTK